MAYVQDYAVANLVPRGISSGIGLGHLKQHHSKRLDKGVDFFGCLKSLWHGFLQGSQHTDADVKREA